MNILEQDLHYNWHPCAQMQELKEIFPPLVITSAQGSFVTTENGQQLIDVTSSWWCKSLGHNHPRLRQALKKQLEKFEHVSFANTTHATIAEFAEQLTQLTKPLDKIFYASDGSCAVEIALKMAVHAQQLRGQAQRYQIMALRDAYHGETGLALSVSDLGIYREPYAKLLMPVEFVQAVPYVNHQTDPLWQNCEIIWPAILMQLEKNKQNLAAIIVEPIVQGASGMQIYSADFLKRLREWTEKNNVFLIADEIMTGLGRTGLPLACQHADIIPDFMCLGKGITSGFLPLSLTLTSEAIYQLFYDNYEKGKAFLHSHTFSGNALAVACALETLKIFHDENIFQQVIEQEKFLQQCWSDVAEATGKLTNLRGIGAIVAGDLNFPQVQTNPRYTIQVMQKSVAHGLLIRPVGKTLYWLPPLNCNRETLIKLRDATIETLREIE